MKPPPHSSTIYAVIAVVAVLLALLPAVFPEIDLAVSDYFLQADPPVRTAKWLWVELINEYTPTVFRTLAVASLVLWLLVRRSKNYCHWALPVAFFGLSLLLGPGIVANGLKEITLRARPFHVLEFGGDKQFAPALRISNQCKDNCAFVSGHAADGFFLVGLMLLSRRRRAWWVAIGIASGLAIGFARVSVGAHWLSDVLWSFPVTLVCSWVVWVGLTRFYRPFPAPENDLKKAAT